LIFTYVSILHCLYTILWRTTCIYWWFAYSMHLMYTYRSPFMLHHRIIILSIYFGLFGISLQRIWEMVSLILQIIFSPVLLGVLYLSDLCVKFLSLHMSNLIPIFVFWKFDQSKVKVWCYFVTSIFLSVKCTPLSC
jgi:Na+/alanine symporter